MYRIVALFISLVLVSPVVKAYSSSDCVSQKCIAVVDAGSTGSRLHVYSYELDNTNSPININEVWSKKIKPGLATIESNPTTLDAYLSQLFAGAPEQSIPVYFYATAGMRLQPPAKQNIYYQIMQQWFKEKSQWQLIEAKTITGNQEALFDWLSVNYSLGTLQKLHTQTIGVMDMGGASVQVVFPVHSKQEVPIANSTAEIDLYGQHFNLFVYSFLGLGQTEVLHQFLNSSACFANEYPLPDGDAGQGDASSCEHEIAHLMNAVHNVNNLIHPLLLENPVTTWYSLGGITNLADSELFHFDGNHFTNQNLLQQADTGICHQAWSMLNEKFPDEEYIYQYCLLSSYYYALMVDGYGLLPEEEINYLPLNQRIDWTIGVVLHH